MALTIHKLHELLENRSLSAVEITNAMIAHKHKVEPQVQAYLSHNDEVALQQAAKVDEKIKNGQISDPTFQIC